MTADIRGASTSSGAKATPLGGFAKVTGAEKTAGELSCLQSARIFFLDVAFRSRGMLGNVA